MAVHRWLLAMGVLTTVTLPGADPAVALGDHAADYVMGFLEDGMYRLDIDSHTRDWGYQAGSRNATLNVLSNRYLMAFDQMAYQLDALAPLAHPLAEDDALLRDVSALNGDPLGRVTDVVAATHYRAADGLGLSFALVADGVRWDITGRPVNRTQLIKSQQTINCGRFLQQRFYRDPTISRLQGTTRLYDTTTLNPVRSGLELCAWPDRVGLILRAEAAVAVTSATLEATFRYQPAVFPVCRRSLDGSAVALSAGHGDGLVVLAPAGARLTWDADQGTITSTSPAGAWAADSDHAVGLVMLPIRARILQDFENLVAAEQEGVQISMRRLGKGLTSSYAPIRAAEAPLAASTMVLNQARGCIEISEPRYDSDIDTAWQEYQVTLTNSAAVDRTIRLNFQNVGTWPTNDIGNSLLETGGACRLTDDPVDGTMTSLLTAGTDLGIPVQLGKNFHQSGTDDNPDRFRGRWIHRFTMLRVPAGTTQRFRVVQLYQWYGGQRAVASHAHLCTVGFNKGAGTGYGSAPDQQWDEMTQGASGESITFGLGNDKGLTFGNDVREAFTTDPARNSYGGNVGGLGIMAYYGTAGERHNTIQEKTSWVEGGPNQTVVAYGRLSDDRALALRTEVRLGRTDDIIRTRFHLRYDVRAPLSFSRLGLFQLGTQGYNYAYFTEIARGETGTVAETWAATAAHARTAITTGSLPWFSCHGITGYTDFSAGALTGTGTIIHPLDAARSNRGLIIRSWRGSLGGVAVTRPSFQAIQQRDYSKVRVDGTADYRASSFLELTPPPGVTRLSTGDWLEADLDVVLIPTEISGTYSTTPTGTTTRSYPYRGPNTAFGTALDAGRDTPAMTAREATGNLVTVTATGTARVVATSPVTVASTDGVNAGFRLSGGLAWLPVTITGLTTWRTKGLQVLQGTTWASVAPATEAQTAFDAVSRTWSVTWIVPRDGMASGSAQDYRLDPVTALSQPPAITVIAAPSPEVLITP